MATDRRFWRYAFGDYVADTRAFRVSRRGVDLHLEPKAFDVLVYLLDRRGELVTKQELIDAVWEGTAVTDNAITRVVAQLRRALDDPADQPRYIETIPRRGYRFLPPPSVPEDGHPSRAAEVARPGPRLGKVRTVSRPPWRLAAAAAAALGLALALGGLFVVARRPARSPELPRVIPLTSLAGSEYSPALSPDGNQVAFTWDGGDEEAPDLLYVQLVDTGPMLRLSEGPESAGSPAWSPDGRQIAFLRRRPGAGTTEVAVVAALGGPARAVGTTSSRLPGLAWSPDGHGLALVDRPSGRSRDGIVLLSLDDGSKKELTVPPPDVDGDTDPRFSPDGGRLAYIRRPIVGHTADLYVLHLATGRVERVTTDRTGIPGMDWTEDGRELVFSSTRTGSQGRSSLWRVGAEGGAPQRLLLGEDVFSLSIARRGHRLAYVRRDWDADIWRVHGPGATDPRIPVLCGSSTRVDYAPRHAPDGRRVAFSSLRTGANEIWVANADGTGLQQLTALDYPRLAVGDWSPDGERLAFQSNHPGPYEIFAIAAAGGPPQRLTEDPFDKFFPAWSRDGKWIYYNSRRTGDFEIWKSPAAGGGAVQVTRKGGTHAYESTDGRTLYYVKRMWGQGPPGVWRMPVAGGIEERVADSGEAVAWGVYDSGICYVPSNRPGPPRIECLNLGSGQTTSIPLPHSPMPLGFSVASDGRSILYVESVRDERDLMRVEGFQ